jgi:hypothetical protein
MKRTLTLLVLPLLATLAQGETYSWTDGSGTHYTDSLGSVPPKYREEALARTREDEVPAVPTDEEIDRYYRASDDARRTRGAKKAKQYNRGKMLSPSEEVGLKKEGCLLSYSIQPGENVAWNPNAYKSGVMRIPSTTEDICRQDCIDNARQKSLDAARGWVLYGSCTYYGQEIWRK